MHGRFQGVRTEGNCSLKVATKLPVITLLDSFPSLSQCYTQGFLSLLQLLNLLSGDLSSLCGQEVNLVVPDQVSVTFMMVKADLCEVNYTRVTAELTGVIDFDRIQRVVSEACFYIVFLSFRNNNYNNAIEL